MTAKYISSHYFFTAIYFCYIVIDSTSQIFNNILLSPLPFVYMHVTYISDSYKLKQHDLPSFQHDYS